MAVAAPFEIRPGSRRVFLVAATVSTLFAVYGSLVPFRYQPLPWESAVLVLRHAAWHAFDGTSRMDFVANVLLFIPIGFFWSAALEGEPRRPERLLLSAVFVFGAALALSVGVEFTQAFFPPRHVAVSDVVGETTGAAVGVLTWILWGARLRRWLDGLWCATSRLTVVGRLLTLYLVAYVVTQVLPLDVTLDVSELADRYRAGRLCGVPFGCARSFGFDQWWSLGRHVVLATPLGALLLLWSREKSPRPVRRASMLAAAGFLLLECAQVFVFSAVADATDLLTTTAGAIWGSAMMARWLQRDQTAQRDVDPSRRRLRFAAGAALWSATLALSNWAPFDFVLDPVLFVRRLPELLNVPLSNYWAVTEFQAFMGLCDKLLPGVMLGVLLAMRSRSRSLGHHLAGAGFESSVVLGSIELGQMLLPGRVPDVTDVLVGVCGALIGAWCANLLTTSASRASKPAVRLPPSPPPQRDAPSSANRVPVVSPDWVPPAQRPGFVPRRSPPPTGRTDSYPER